MKHVLVALLLVGCVSAKQIPTHPIPPKTDETIAKTLNTATQALQAFSGVVHLICSNEGEGTDVCVSLSTSLSMVAFAVSEAQKLYTTYQQTGLGVELVHHAIDRVVLTIKQLNENTMDARLGYGIDSPVASAYCTKCCGVVVQPKGKGTAAPAAAKAANPYRESVPAPKAP